MNLLSQMFRSRFSNVMHTILKPSVGSYSTQSFPSFDNWESKADLPEPSNPRINILRQG